MTFRITKDFTHLDTLGIHLVPLVRFGPIQPSITLLANEQVREVDFLEFKLDGLDELFRDFQRSFGT